MNTIEFWIPTLLAIFLAIFSFLQRRKIITLEKKMDKQLFVHKLQFEKEFNIYNELWINLVEVRGAVSLLKIKMEPAVENETYDQTITRRLSEAIALANTTISVVEKNKPFYAQNVFDEIQKAIKLIKSEIIDVQYGDRNVREYWDEGEKNLIKIIALIDVVCEAIRGRIGILNTNI